MILITMIIMILIGIIRIIMRAIRAIRAIIIKQRIFRKTGHVCSMSRK